MRQEITPVAKRRKRLRAIEKAIGKARALADDAMQDDVGDDLYSAWCEANVRYDWNPNDLELPLKLVRIQDEFEKVVAGLHALEAAASRAADDVPAGPSGKPPNLPAGYIRTLADIYREFTGRTAGTGWAPFTRFVILFRGAVDPSYKTTDESGTRVDQSMIDAIKLVLGKRRKRPNRRKQPKRRRLIPSAGQQVHRRSTK